MAQVVPAQGDGVRARQWYLDAMHAEEMWKQSTGAGVTVAVIDTGVESSVPDLRGRVLQGKDFSGHVGGAESDPHNHGTRVAEFIAGTGKSLSGLGTRGLAPGARIIPLRVSDGTDASNAAEGAEKFGAALASAIRYAAGTEAKVINISMGQDVLTRPLADAVHEATARGKLVFAAVGNSGDAGNAVQYPAALPGVIGVAAVDKTITATKESQRGPQVDLAAPGEDMTAVCANGRDICTSHGTSDAAALASASAALLWSAHPDWTANQVLRVLINTAGGPKSGGRRSDTIGYGVVRPRVALQNPGDPGPPDVSPLSEKPDHSPSPQTPSGRDGQKTGPDSADDGGDGISGSKGAALVVGTSVLVCAVIAIPFIIVRRRRS
ncbi:type VII secretion-associated serine protease mycosin [Streptomyces cinnamoneus]|uniref:type VII secretion-associated serine protease mycosin n=1 Tax=Streptomyces cinnamoneus TaxID=53446 RepID=UPI0015E3CFE2|nr:type VII secretion-associated serine protease mycosin [Streptomyces cinnamoneus]